MRLIMVICCAIIACANFAFASDTVIGSVKTATGKSTIVRDGAAISANVGARLFQNDVLETGDDGALGIIFRDNTILSLGPNSKITINEFVFIPAEEKFSFVTKMLKGTASYISGLIVKLSPDSARFETPTAMIGIRGTRFLVQVEDK